MTAGQILHRTETSVKRKCTTIKCPRELHSKIRCSDPEEAARDNVFICYKLQLLTAG